MSKTIFINGVTYRSYGEIPPEVRHQLQGMLSKFADRDLNGIPDIFEDEELGHFVFSSGSRIILNDKEYNSVKQLPPFARKAFEQVMVQAVTGRDGMPGYQSLQTRPDEGDAHPSWQTDMPPLRKLRPDRRVQEPVSTSSTFITALIFLSIFAIGILLLLLLLLR